MVAVSGCGKSATIGGTVGGSKTSSLAGQLYDVPASFSGDWKDVTELIEDQKFQEAAKKSESLMNAAREKAKEEEWAHGLIETARLRMSLHGYETAVRFLKEQPWPKSELAHTILQLYYAQSLVVYSRAYSYEIAKREKVSSKQKVDLKAWTKEEIFAEAARSFDDLWKRREALGVRPIQDLARYINRSGYPAHVRGTLRDLVSYLFVELLADTRGWRPEDSNDVFRLSLASLLSGPGAGKPVDLTDPGVHPLTRIGAILDDLEAWHLGRKEREAALETRLERTRRLLASFKKQADRDKILSDLESRLGSLRDVEWWSMGMAVLANAIQEDGDLVRAHDLAAKGEAAYPKSPGGYGCTTLLKKIEGWEYDFSGMMSDAPAKRSLEIQHRNLGALYLRAYPVDLVRRIESARDYNLLPAYQEVERLLSGEKPAAEWKVDLPATPDFKMHRTFVTPPMTRPGLYVVIASMKPDFNKDANKLQAVVTIVTDLVLLSRTRSRDEQVVEATVLSGSTGVPVAGAEVILYRYDWQSGHHAERKGVANAEGFVEFADLAERTSYFVVARHGAEVALDGSYRSIYRYTPPSRRTEALVYTDRSIYRPLQRIFWKVVLYTGDTEDASFHTTPNAPISMRLVDPNSQTVETKSVTTNEYGTASGEFNIPTGRVLGFWRVESGYGRAQVRVEEYKRPTFETKLEDPKTALRLNRPASFTGEARYYFGLPVVNGKVRWRVSREPVYPPWSWWWWYRPPAVQSQPIASGVSSLDAEGKYKIEFTPEADERDAARGSGVSYRYSVAADVTDEGGETRTATRVFRLGFVSVEASIDTEKSFFVAGAPAAISVRRTDLNGSPRAGRGTWRLLETVAPKATLLPADQPIPQPPDRANAFATPGDKLRSRASPDYSPEAVLRQWADGAEVAQGELKHGADGKAKVRLKSLKPGVYRLRYETLDDFGARFEIATELVVLGAGVKSDIRVPFLFRAERDTVAVGETVRLAALSGLGEQRLIFERFRNGKRVSRELRSADSASILELPVTEADRGGFTVVLTGVRDHQVMTASISVFVPWDDRELKISFSSFRDKIRPGTKETWRVSVTSPKGAGERSLSGSAELLAYMYDRSLDLFTPHHPPNPLSVYPRRFGWNAFTATLSRSNPVWNWGGNYLATFSPPSGDSLRFYGAYAIGGPGRRGGGPVFAKGAVAAPAPASQAREEAKNEKAGDKAGKKMDALRGELEGKDGRGEAAAEPAPLRSNFAETAFWQPHLLLGEDGAATIEFSVPDSVTSWNVWVHAVTRDLRAASLHQETRSVKELMVRPYLPRFLREGDAAEMKIVVNNASEGTLRGTLTFDILDPDTRKSVRSLFGLTEAVSLPFTAEKGAGTNLGVKLKAPARVGSYAFQVTASTGSFSDGELRPVPVLPSRMHLLQSRFVTLKNADRKKLHFADMAKGDDPSLIQEQLVVTIDAQLFYQVLAALPYLTKYPYECTEQTLNRFVSTGIVSKLFDKYPAVARMATEFSKRTTPLETWDAVDPNRKMSLEETPWLEMAKGGRASPYDINVLDPRIARAERESAIAKLRKAQTSNGAFPWFPGGPPSPYMTLYLLHGFAKAVEFGVDVPKEMVERAWRYVASHYRDEYAEKMLKKDCCWEFLTFLNYVASAYPDSSWTGGALSDSERKQILDHSFKHWKQHSPYLKGYLALTLKRAGRQRDAELVFSSVMDSSKTNDEQGTYWAAEDRSWLWYNDTIETHAFALRTLLDLTPADARKHGLVQWLLLNKKLNQWKSTRATAEVIYSLIHYLKGEGALGVREDAKVTIGPKQVSFVFEPDQYTGKKNQIVIPGAEIDPKTQSTIVVEKESKGTVFASATWHFSTEKLPTEERGDFFQVSRRFFKREHKAQGFVLTPLSEGTPLRIGDEIEVQLSLRSKNPAEYVHLRVPRAAGLEPENAVSRFRWDLGIVWYEETRDSANNFFFERLPQGEYTFKYRLRANMAGTFRVGPATVQSMYAPEFAAYSTGEVMTIGAAP
jgi:uncharacterized protein YfaS (alpha-2-macroglobulin family)